MPIIFWLFEKKNIFSKILTRSNLIKFHKVFSLSFVKILVVIEKLFMQTKHQLDYLLGSLVAVKKYFRLIFRLRSFWKLLMIGIQSLLKTLNFSINYYWKLNTNFDWFFVKFPHFLNSCNSWTHKNGFQKNIAS